MMVVLPWPSRTLAPNMRVHWAQKARAAKIARSEAAWWARAAGVRPVRKPPQAFDVSLIFHPPDARRRDLDNLIASMKASLDGIADAMGVDDNLFRIHARRGEPKEFGAVRIEIAEAS